MGEFNFRGVSDSDLPEPRQADTFIGEVGSDELLKTEPLNYFTSPEGRVGVLIADLGRITSGLNGDSILWIDLDAKQETKKSSFLGGRVQLDSELRELIVDGDARRLAKREFEVMNLLAKKPGRPATNEEFFNTIWGEWHGSGNVLAITIMTIRKKLGEHRWILRTIRGVGYILDDRQLPDDIEET